MFGLHALLQAAAATAAANGAEYGVNPALTNTLVIVGNVLMPAGRPVPTVSALQDLLDANPNTAVFLRHSRFEVISDGNRTGITLNSSRSLVLDDASLIFCASVLPAPLHLPAAEAKYGSHMVLLTGRNVGLRGGRLLQLANTSATPSISVGVRVFMAEDAKLSGVTLNGSWGQAVRVNNGEGATSPPFDGCPSYFGTGCQAPQLPYRQGLVFSGSLARSELMLRGLVHAPVSIINNIILASTPAVRGVWLTWCIGVIVAGNTVRGPFHYGIDLDAMASHCVLTGNDVRESTHAALFVEMQCLHNVVTSNTLRVAPSASYAIELNSFLNYVVLNDLGHDGLKISGLTPYPVALSNRLVANTLGHFSSQHAGCGNYASENVVRVLNISNGMRLTNCTMRSGDHCDNYLNASEFGCIDSAAGEGAMTFSDVAPLAPTCVQLSGEWTATGHCDDALRGAGREAAAANCTAVVHVVQRGAALSWRGLYAGSAYEGSGEVHANSIPALLNATYHRSAGTVHTIYKLLGTVHASCSTIEWQRKHDWFESWTKTSDIAVAAPSKESVSAHMQTPAPVPQTPSLEVQLRMLREQIDALGAVPVV